MAAVRALTACGGHVATGPAPTDAAARVLPPTTEGGVELSEAGIQPTVPTTGPRLKSLCAGLCDEVAQNSACFPLCGSGMSPAACSRACNAECVTGSVATGPCAGSYYYYLLCASFDMLVGCSDPTGVDIPGVFTGLVFPSCPAEADVLRACLPPDAGAHGDAGGRDGGVAGLSEGGP